MTRDLTSRFGGEFDLLVIGGGIHGLFAAHQAASRGLRVALVERDDYGSGLSFNHQRTIHGGLRSLQSGQILKTREQVLERRNWALMAPGLVRPLPFLIGTYRRSKHARGRIGLGLRLYDLAGFDRNTGLPSGLRLPASTVVPIEDAVSRFPGMPRSGLTGAGVWHDYQVTFPDRLNWLVALAAERAGAVIANYAEALAPVRAGHRLVGARVRDCATGAECQVAARATLIAAGAGAGRLFEAFGLDEPPPTLAAAANLLVDRPALGTALAAPDGSGRMLTAVPWGGFTLVGTFQSTAPASPDQAFPLALDDMLADANAAFPALALARRDVRLVHRGLTPAVVVGDALALMPDARIIRHRQRGTDGAVSLIGVKFTTARLAARAAVDAVVDELGPGPWAEAPLVRRLPFADGEARAASVEVGAVAPQVSAHLDAWYGPEAAAVLTYSIERGLTRLLDNSTVIEGEIAYAVEHAQAIRLADAVLRRSWLGATGHPGDTALERAADIMGHLLGWTAEQRRQEVAAVAARYDPE